LMLELSELGPWRPPILRTVASAREGVSELFDAIGAHRAFLDSNGLLAQRRSERAAVELREIVARRIEERAGAACEGPEFDQLVKEVAEHRLDPYAAAEQI